MKQLRTLLILLALCFTAGLARAQSIIQMGVQPIYNSSGNLAASSFNLNLTPPNNKFAYLCGFAVTGAGATAASVVDVQATGLATSATLHFELVIPVGATVSIAPLIVNFTPCLQGNGIGANATVSLPSFGAGNTNAAVSAWGYLQ